MPDRGKQLILWITGFSGTLLLYAAYKGKSPLSLLDGTTTASGSATSSTSGAPVPSNPSTGTASPTGGPIRLEAVTLPGSDTVSGGYVYDANGNPISQIPAAYADNPNSYIPSDVD